MGNTKGWLVARAAARSASSSQLYEGLIVALAIGLYFGHQFLPKTLMSPGEVFLGAASVSCANLIVDVVVWAAQQYCGYAANYFWTSRIWVENAGRCLSGGRGATHGLRGALRTSVGGICEWKICV